MIKNNVGKKISRQLLLALIVSLVVSLGLTWIFLIGVMKFFIVNPQYLSNPVFYNMVSLLTFVVGIGFFVLTFFLLINKKIKYLKYVSKRVKEIANEGFGSTIEIRGYDEIAELCRNINSMSR